MSRRYECPNTGAWVRVNDNDTIDVSSDEDHFVVHRIPLGLIHRALEREGYTVCLSPPVKS